MSKNSFNPYARRRSRQIALQALYALELNDANYTELCLLAHQQPNYQKADENYLKTLLRVSLRK